MSTVSILSPDSSALPANLFLDQATREKLERVIDDGTPPNTQAAYRSDMRYFWAWASAIGWTSTPVLPVPVEIVAKFIVDHLEGLDPHIETKMVADGLNVKRVRTSFPL